MAAQVCGQVVREPIVRGCLPIRWSRIEPDLGIQGVWTPQVKALLDIKVIGTDAPTRQHRTPESILESGAQEKKLYKKAVENRRGILLLLL